MPKNKGKKHKRYGKMRGQLSSQIKKVKAPGVSPEKARVPSPLMHSVGPTSSYHESTENVDASHSGFIFMCSPSTKLECYLYRVFGLPSGKKEVVEEIKPGTKLFLFDFQLKLLYGIYEATSAGEMNLEPAAFGGRFPAQVKFRIFKECLPLPENSLRSIIRENYKGSKFKQELSRTQVTKLVSSFHPLTASSSQPALENASFCSLSVPSSSGRHHQFTGRLPSIGDPYLGELHRSHMSPFVEPQYVSKVNALPHGYHRASAYVERMHPAVHIQNLTSAIGYYVGNSQQPTFREGAFHGVQDQSLYTRAIEERPLHDQATSLERRYIPADGGSRDQVTNQERSYLDTVKNQVTDFERRFHQQLPLKRGDALVHKDNAAAYNPAAPALYNNTATSSVIPAQQDHTPYLGGTQYQDNDGVTCNYDPSVAAPSSSEYTASSALYQVNNAAAPAYNTYSAAPAYNTYPAAPVYNPYSVSAAPVYNSFSTAPAYNTYPAAPAYNTYSVAAAPAYNTYPAPPVYNSFSTAPAYDSYSTAPSSSEFIAPSTQCSIDASGVFAYALPTTDVPSTAQPQVSSHYYSYDSANHVNYQS